jgi:NAD(P)-dependent dehydrogenase (short-subunit alcohol dehydrogenase family)
MTDARKPKSPPPQHQDHRPGATAEMNPKPQDRAEGYRGSGKLEGKIALVTGGDSGIGRSVCVHFAKEGADVVFVYLDEDDDAAETTRLVEAEGRRALALRGDIGRSDFANEVVDEVLARFGHIDVLVNNAAEQHPQDDITQITDEQLERTFRTNVFGQFYLVRAAMPHLKDGAAIINTTSVTAYRGSPTLLDYSSTKGAILSFTRALAEKLAERNIRVNGVAPGPIWTPLIPSTFPEEKVAKFGESQPLGRVGQPDEVAPCFVFLASRDASYMSGQILHPNGGEVVNG